MSRKAIAAKRLIHSNHGVRHIRFLRKPFQIVRANFRADLIINAIVYGERHHWDSSGDALSQPERNSGSHPGRQRNGGSLSDRQSTTLGCSL
ncbi:hypothetical protein QUA92_34810 [Microcoleus sp. F8-C1]